MKPVPFNRPFLTYDEAVLRETARRYGVEYLVTIDRDSGIRLLGSVRRRRGPSRSTRTITSASGG